MLTFDEVRDIPPFTRMKDMDSRTVLRLSHELPLRKGKVLYYQGDHATSVHLLLSGSLRGFISVGKGTITIVDPEGLRGCRE
jgi:CRP-like cAMP-binding protein